MTTEHLPLNLKATKRGTRNERTITAVVENGRLFIRSASKGGTPLAPSYINPKTAPEAGEGWREAVIAWVAETHDITEIS